MQITDIRIRKISSPGKLRALCSVTFDEDFVVHDMKVIEGENGFFIAMPSRLMPQGEHRDIAHPTNSAMRERLQTSILEAYNKLLEPGL